MPKKASVSKNHDLIISNSSRSMLRVLSRNFMSLPNTEPIPIKPVITMCSRRLKPFIEKYANSAGKS
jgi:hypothetical protein